jgi:hypothetical protein
LLQNLKNVDVTVSPRTTLNGQDIIVRGRAAPRPRGGGGLPVAAAAALTILCAVASAGVAGDRVWAA